MLRFKIKMIIKSIKRLIKWIPVIWKDSETHYDCLYEIIEFKIKNMQEFWESGESNLYQNEINDIIAEMQTARNLLNKIKSYNYYDFGTEEEKGNDRKQLFELLNDKIEGWWD